LKLFGVRIYREIEEGEEGEAGEEDVIRKSASMGNLVSCAVGLTGENGGGENSGYHSDGGLLKSSRKKRRSAVQERKRGRSSPGNFYFPVLFLRQSFSMINIKNLWFQYLFDAYN
jgi:hypothetical protein